MDENFDNPAWVREQLAARNRPVCKTDAEAADAAFAEHWAEKGGRKPGEPITADQVNRGHLMDMISLT